MKLPIKIDLPRGFLDEEVRLDYKVSKELKAIWAVQLDMLVELSRICKKHGIHFQVAYGTLLGAVRHKGFIPWDDDMDVWMLRDEYEKLLKVADEFKSPYFLQTALSDRKFFTMNPRLRNSLTTAILAGNESMSYNNGVFVDIYIMDGYTDSRFGYWLQYHLVRFCNRLAVAYNRRGFVFLHAIPYSWIIGLLRRVRMLFNGSARWFSPIGGFSKTGYKYGMTRKELLETIELPYEHITVPVMKNYEYALNGEYGDWRLLPPQEKRGIWHDGQIVFDPFVPYRDFLKRRGEV